MHYSEAADKVCGTDIEWEDIILVPEFLPKLSGREHALVQRNTATRKASTSEPGNRVNEENDHPKGEECFHGKQAAVIPSLTMQQALLNEKVLSE